MKNFHPIKSVKLQKIPSQPGIYTLLLRITTKIRIQSRNHSKFELPPALYVYGGSALGTTSSNLRHRIHRHFQTKPQKTLFWHIDFLLQGTGPPILCVFAKTQQPLECLLIQTLQTKGGRPVLGFGSSDCKVHCEGHLLSFPNNSDEICEKLLQAFQTLKLEPIITC